MILGITKAEECLKKARLCLEVIESETSASLATGYRDSDSLVSRALSGGGMAALQAAELYCQREELPVQEETIAAQYEQWVSMDFFLHQFHLALASARLEKGSKTAAKMYAAAIRAMALVLDKALVVVIEELVKMADYNSDAYTS